ncbi:hypothetical protein ACR75P_10730 [Faecalicoccus pleomorphus]
MILMALICYSGVGNLSNSGSSWSDYASALSNSLSGLSFACILYYIDLLLVILLVIGWGLKIFYFKEKGLICNLLTLAFSCKSFRYASENI